jgi:uncharacterized protein (TIGR02117 family)
MTRRAGVTAGVLVTAALLGAGCLGPVADLYPPRAGEVAVPVYVIAHEWHAGLAVRAGDVPAALWPERADFPRAEYLEVGWGDRDYWQAHEPGIGLGFKALLLPTPSVVRVVGVSAPLAAIFPESEIIEVRLSRAGFERLSRFVHDSFARDGDTRTPPLTPGWPDVLFYPARGAYHALRTSNTWTAAALRAAGFPITPAYALTAGNVICQTRGHGRVIHRPARHAAGILMEC